MGPISLTFTFTFTLTFALSFVVAKPASVVSVAITGRLLQTCGSGGRESSRARFRALQLAKDFVSFFPRLRCSEDFAASAVEPHLPVLPDFFGVLRPDLLQVP